MPDLDDAHYLLEKPSASAGSQFWRLAIVTGLAGACLMILAALSSGSHVSGEASPRVFGLVPPEGLDLRTGMSRLAKLEGLSELPPRITSQIAALPATPPAATRGLRDVARAINFHRPTAMETESYKMSQCVGAVYDMANYVGWAGLNIDALTIGGTCPDKSDDKSCSANVVGLIFNLLWVVANAAQVPVWCLAENMTDSYHSHAVSCVVAFSVFFATTLQLTSDALSARSDCDFSIEDEDWERFPGLNRFKARVRRRLDDLKQSALQRPHPVLSQHNTSRIARLPPNKWVSYQDRLLQDIADLGPDATRDLEKGVCALIIAQTINDVPYTGTDIWALVNACGELGWKEGDDYKAAQEDCAAGSIAVIADLVNLVTDIAVIIAACPAQRPRKTACVALSSDMATNVLSIGAWLLTVDHSCNLNHSEMPDLIDLTVAS